MIPTADLETRVAMLEQQLKLEEIETLSDPDSTGRLRVVQSVAKPIYGPKGRRSSETRPRSMPLPTAKTEPRAGVTDPAKPGSHSSYGRVEIANFTAWMG